MTDSTQEVIPEISPQAQALKRAASIMGSATAVAKAVGVTSQAVSERLRKNLPATAEWCIPLERALIEKAKAEGRTDIVTRQELRPDIYPPEESAA